MLLAELVRAITDAPRRLERSLRIAEREWIDRRKWVEAKYHEMLDELSKIDEDFNARGLFHSGLRLQARAKARRRYTEEYDRYHREMTRRIQVADVGWLGRKLYRLKYRKKERVPLEEKLLAGIKDQTPIEEQLLKSMTEEEGPATDDKESG